MSFLFEKCVNLEAKLVPLGAITLRSNTHTQCFLYVNKSALQKSSLSSLLLQLSNARYTTVTRSSFCLCECAVDIS